jgi:predicted transcriptional regulator
MPSPQTDPKLAAQALAMADAGYTGAQIAGELPIKRRTVYDIIAGHANWSKVADRPVFAQWRSDQNQRMEAGFRAASANYLVKSLDKDKLDKASTYQLAIAAKLSLEAARLIAGESTQNVDLHVQVTGLDDLAATLSQALLSNPVSPDKTDK